MNDINVLEIDIIDMKNIKKELLENPLTLSDSCTNNTMISTNNGLFTKNCIFRSKNDTILNIQHDKVIIINNTDITQFMKYYEEIKNEYNIIIDSRLNILISFFIVYIDYTIFVYNPYTLKINTLFEYISSTYDTLPFELSTNQIRIISVVKIIIDYY